MLGAPFHLESVPTEAGDLRTCRACLPVKAELASHIEVTKTLKLQDGRSDGGFQSVAPNHPCKKMDCQLKSIKNMDSSSKFIIYRSVYRIWEIDVHKKPYIFPRKTTMAPSQPRHGSSCGKSMPWELQESWETCFWNWNSDCFQYIYIYIISIYIYTYIYIYIYIISI